MAKTKKDEINELLIKEKELRIECQKYSDRVTTIKREIEKITEKVQSLCDHEWVTDIQPYQKEVYCKKCLLFDWDKSRYY